MKGYPQYLWFVVLALLLVCTGCSNEGETEDDNNQHVKVEGFYVKGLENVNACVEFDVEVDAAGTYTLHVMGYNYSKGTATCSLYVNGQNNRNLDFRNNPTGAKSSSGIVGSRHKSNSLSTGRW